MKKILFLLVILPLAILSCKKSEPPVADFIVEYTGDAEVGEDIYFTNNSRNAVSFRWDFGDGYGSDEAEPVYVYNSTGTFTIKLTATGEDGDVSTAEFVINILVPTLLVVDIREWDTDYYVPGASVLVYETLADWDSNDPSKALYEGFSDQNGIAVFSNLEEDDYFLDIWEETHDNWDFRNPIDNVLYIQTPDIIPHFVNWFIAYVDVVDHGKSASRGAKDLTIRKIERRLINPAKPSIRNTTDWKELYERRVNK